MLFYVSYADGSSTSRFLNTTMMHIPPQHSVAMPYLILDQASRYRTFAERVFNAKLSHETINEDGSLGHCELSIGDQVIMFSESRPEWPARHADLFVYVPDADFTYQEAMKAGGTEVMPLSDQPYGRSGGVKDPCGNIWWITTPPEVGP